MFIKKWLETTPSNDDWFGVQVRTTFQAIQCLFKCDHEWLSYINAPHTQLYLRICSHCGKQEKLTGSYKCSTPYIEGSHHFKWVDINDY